MNPKDWLWANSRPALKSGCREWTGKVGGGGYGYIPAPDARKIGLGAGMTASRAAWMLSHGEIAKGLEVCHSCDNRLCINPEHLWLGSPQDNHADMMKKGRNKPGLKRVLKHPNKFCPLAVTSRVAEQIEMFRAKMRLDRGDRVYLYEAAEVVIEAGLRALATRTAKRGGR